MSLGRFFRRWLPVPDWAAFFNRAQYERFVDLVESDFRSRGLDPRIEEGVVHLDHGDARLGLLNLAQVCKQLPPDDWADAINGHFQSIEQSAHERAALEMEVDDFERIADRLGLRLYPSDYLDNEIGRGAVASCDIPGTVSVLVIDMPTSVATVPADQCATWGLTPDELHERALRNQARLAVPNWEEVDLGDGSTACVLLDESFFVATWALSLDDVVTTPLGPHGALVAIPHRHALIVYPIHDLRVVAAVRGLIPVVSAMFQEGPGSISPSLFWYRSGDWQELPYHACEDGLEFQPPDCFMRMLEQLPPAEDGDADLAD